MFSLSLFLAPYRLALLGIKMLSVPIQPLPNQALQIQLASQSCTINLYQTAFGLFFDLYVGSTLIIGGVICQNLNRLVRSVYLGFVGDFAFIDNQGNSDPSYTGLGSQFTLVYLELADLQALGFAAGATPSAGAGSITNPAAPVGSRTGTFTLSPNSISTVVPNPLVQLGSVVLLEPTTPDAANDMATTSVLPGIGSFTVTHASNPRTDRTFNYVVAGFS